MLLNLNDSVSLTYCRNNDPQMNISIRTASSMYVIVKPATKPAVKNGMLSAVIHHVGMRCH